MKEDQNKGGSILDNFSSSKKENLVEVESCDEVVRQKCMEAAATDLI